MLPRTVLRLRSISKHLIPQMSTSASTPVLHTAPAPAPLPVDNADDLPRFPLSPILKDTPVVQTAAVLIIGDEVLNGELLRSSRVRWVSGGIGPLLTA